MSNPLKKFGEILRSNEEEQPFKSCKITTLSENVRKDIIYWDSNSPLTHYWYYYFTNCMEDYSPYEKLIEYYVDTTIQTLTVDDFDNILMGNDEQFNKWFKKIKPFLHPLYGGNEYSKRFGEIDITPNREVKNVNE